MRYVKDRGYHVDRIMKHHMGEDSKIKTPFIISELGCGEHAWAEVLCSLTKQIIDIFFINLGDGEWNRWYLQVMSLARCYFRVSLAIWMRTTEWWIVWKVKVTFQKILVEANDIWAEAKQEVTRILEENENHAIESRLANLGLNLWDLTDSR